MHVHFGNCSITHAARPMRRASSALLMFFLTFVTLLSFLLNSGKKRSYQLNYAYFGPGSMGRLDPPWSEGNGAERILRIDSSQIDSIYNYKQSQQSKKILTIAMLFYDDDNFLIQNIDVWEQFPESVMSKTKFLIIDDGSPRSTALQIIQTKSKLADIDVVRIIEDKKWNIGGARNLAMSLSSTEYVFLTDSDLKFNSVFVGALFLLVEHARSTFFRKREELIFTQFPRNYTDSRESKPHPAVMLLSTHAYWKAGGCDEDFVGSYGYTDPHFHWRVARTPGLNSVSAASVFPSIASMVEMEKNLGSYASKGAYLDRDVTRNAKLFSEKCTGSRPWSNHYLRFRWKVENE